MLLLFIILYMTLLVNVLKHSLTIIFEKEENYPEKQP